MRKLVGFTNGCFQGLHPGHIHLLTEARKHCDTLIVGLNSDEVIRKLKGREHHILGETLRRQALLTSGLVDAVIVFEEDTPYETMLRLRPDVLIRGNEGRWEVGQNLVYRFVLVDKLPGYSTTKLIAERG